MESLDKYLTLTLKQDIAELYKTSAEILKFLGNSESSPSWLYPTKEAKMIQVDEDVDSEKTYTHYLELTIDRIYFIVNLLLRYLSTLPELELQYAKSCHLTLGRSTALFWKYFKYLIETKTKRVSEQNNERPSKTLQNTSSQTINFINEQCRTCEVAMTCVKSILKALESLNQVEIKKARQDIKSNIFDLTQMESISKLTKTAEKVIDGFCNDYVKTNKSLANYQITLVKSVTTLHKVLEDIRLLDTVHSKLRCKLASDRDAFDNLKTMNNELQKENLENDETITSLKLDLEENKQKLKTLEDKNCSLVEDIRMLRNKCSILDADRTLLKTQLEDMGATSSELKIKSMYLQRKVENLNCELNQAYVNLLDFERRLTNTTDGVERSVEIFNSIFCKIEKISTKSEVSDKAIAVNPEDFHNIVEGNPVKDMISQIHHNNKEIEILKEENGRLTELLRKMESIKNANATSA